MSEREFVLRYTREQRASLDPLTQASHRKFLTLVERMALTLDEIEAADSEGYYGQLVRAIFDDDKWKQS
jgi:hypothetical protein